MVGIKKVTPNFKGIPARQDGANATAQTVPKAPPSEGSLSLINPEGALY
ncbi:hypothetical protein L1047_12925 [Synechococcus sp. Nb3U1]|nr:hypothetical protein [Synechococcus sp. Nb3U1]MCF2972099.1 hypothetical protein [Synechococcus sp. Nb3U1]